MRRIPGGLVAFALIVALTGAARAWAAAPPVPSLEARGAGVGVRTLDSFAAALGVTLGGPDDAQAINAANDAIAAARQSGGLAVALPVGVVVRTSAALRLDNDGGYFCPVAGRCTVRALRLSDSAAATWLVTVNDPYATNLVLSGMVLDGGWQSRRGPYLNAPERDPWLDKQGGVNIAHAFSGTDDGRFRANSRLGSQLPGDTIENLTIANFGGDCLAVAGAGGNFYRNIRVQNCGGHGLTINSYDNQFQSIDVGGMGRACLFFDGQGATDYLQGKVWYCGLRLKRGDDQGVRLTAGGDRLDITVQDAYGDAIYNSGQLNVITAIIDWQGGIDRMDPGPISAYVCAGCDHNVVTLNAAIEFKGQRYPNITRLYRDLVTDGRSGANNIVSINQMGWPVEDRAMWLTGPLDPSNRISVDGVERIPRRGP
jgi:hypothetical protein